MSRRYLAIQQAPRSWWQYVDDRPPPGPMTVFEQDKAPKPTGLLDASGTPLYAVDENPVGFVRFGR